MSEINSQKITMNINVLGQNISLKTTLSQEESDQIVKFVEGKVNEILAKDRTILPAKAALLAALNVYSEYFKQKKENEEFLKQVRDKSSRILGVLEKEFN